jgi:hypothetical protein
MKWQRGWSHDRPKIPECIQDKEANIEAIPNASFALVRARFPTLETAFRRVLIVQEAVLITSGPRHNLDILFPLWWRCRDGENATTTKSFWSRLFICTFSVALNGRIFAPPSSSKHESVIIERVVSCWREIPVSSVLFPGLGCTLIAPT